MKLPTPRMLPAPKASPKMPGGVAGKGPPLKRRPALPFMVENVPDPLAGMVSDPEDAEAQCEEALTLAQQAFRAAEKKLADEVKDYRPIDFFKCLVFATPAQAQAFAVAVGQPINQQFAVQASSVLAAAPVPTAPAAPDAPKQAVRASAAPRPRTPTATADNA